MALCIMGVYTLSLVDDPEFDDGDGDEPDNLICDCGNTLMQISADFLTAWCPLCGAMWLPPD